MMLTQVFKTLANVQRRAAFENAHSKVHRYLLVRCDEQGAPVSVDRAYDPTQTYTWRLDKVRREQ